MSDYNTSTPSVARDWGFADYIAGKSQFDGYDYFVGAALREYLTGWHLAQSLAK